MPNFLALIAGLNPEDHLQDKHKRNIKRGHTNAFWDGACLAALGSSEPAPGGYRAGGWHRKPRLWHVYKDGHGNKAAPRRSLYLLRRRYFWAD